MSNSEENSKAMQRQLLQGEAEFDKQKSLLNAKIEHIESSLEQSKTKEVEQTTEIRNQKKELLNSFKQNTSKYEEEIKDLKEKYEITRETL